MNGNTDGFTTLQQMLDEEGWTDVGAGEAMSESKPGQPVCHTNHAANESRIDYVYASRLHMPAITKCNVEREDTSPTRKSPRIKAKVSNMARSFKTVRNTPKFSTLFE